MADVNHTYKISSQQTIRPRSVFDCITGGTSLAKLMHKTNHYSEYRLEKHRENSGIIVLWLLLFFKDFIYLFLERGKGREKEREKNISVWLLLTCPLLGIWPAAQACALTGD